MQKKRFEVDFCCAINPVNTVYTLHTIYAVLAISTAGVEGWRVFI